MNKGDVVLFFLNGILKMEEKANLTDKDLNEEEE